MIKRRLQGIHFWVHSPSHYQCVEVPAIQIYFSGAHWFLIIGATRTIPHATLSDAAAHLQAMCDACLMGVAPIDAVMLG